MLAKTPVWKDLLINFVAEGVEITSLICLFTFVGINAVRFCNFPNVEVRNYVRYPFFSSESDEKYFLVWC